MNFTYNNQDIPLAPGAYLLNGVQNSISTWWSFPIYCSMKIYDNYGIANIDDYYLVMPKFKLEVFRSDNYVTLNNTIDNTNGSSPIYQQVALNQGNSCKLYYNTTQISDSFSYFSNTPPVSIVGNMSK